MNAPPGNSANSIRVFDVGRWTPQYFANGGGMGVEQRDQGRATNCCTVASTQYRSAVVATSARLVAVAAEDERSTTLLTADIAER